jgi:hypothetical protein
MVALSATFFVYGLICPRSIRVQSLSRYSTSHLLDRFRELRARSAHCADTIEKRLGSGNDSKDAALKAGKQFENELDQLIVSRFRDFTPVILEKLEKACREALRFKQMCGVVRGR